MSFSESQAALPRSTTAPSFGPNVYVFDPSVAGSTINSTVNAISNPSVDQAQFSTNRAAVLFKPGSYTGVSSEVGFYTSISGLGTTPDATVLNGGGLYIDIGDDNGNDTTNFWRSMENLNIPVPSGGTEHWAVSQGASLRRMHIAGSLELTANNCPYASGGFIADTKIDGTENLCSQQQWYTRDSMIGGSSNNVWNFVYSGVTGAPAQKFPNVTTLATTPVSREKPYLYVDGSGNYNVFSPAVKSNSSGHLGQRWAGQRHRATDQQLSSSRPPSSTLAQINSALSSGKNLILTPGIYKYTGAIAVTKANTVVLGLGYATLVSQGGNSVLTIADVDGVQIAGLIVDAGTSNAPVLAECRRCRRDACQSRRQSNLAERSHLPHRRRHCRHGDHGA